jgi:uncharacterized MAPEG superfamily protein
LLGWIVAVLALFVAQTLIPPLLQYYGRKEGRWDRVKIGLGPRDNPPPMPLSGQRAQRALANMFEALPVFVTLALLLEIEGRTSSTATAGAMIFFLARLLYLPSYIFGLYGVRTLFWVIGWAGIVTMLIALLG